MPTVAAFVDELRAMGLTPKVVWASESGITVGKRPRDENVFDIPPMYRLDTGTPKVKK